MGHARENGSSLHETVDIGHSSSETYLYLEVKVVLPMLFYNIAN